MGGFECKKWIDLPAFVVAWSDIFTPGISWAVYGSVAHCCQSVLNANRQLLVVKRACSVLLLLAYTWPTHLNSVKPYDSGWSQT